MIKKYSFGVLSDMETQFLSTSTSKQNWAKSVSTSNLDNRNLMILGLRLYSSSIQVLFITGLSSPENTQLNFIIFKNKDIQDTKKQYIITQNRSYFRAMVILYRPRNLVGRQTLRSTCHFGSYAPYRVCLVHLC